MKFLRSLWTACRLSVQGVWTVALWTLWLALTGLLVVQSYILATNELAVPDFVLRRFERQIAESGLRVTFARTLFDPTGRVLVEEARVSLPEYPDPVLSARAIYVQLNPWSLAIGRFELREIRLTGASVAVPAMLTPSGRTEEIIRDLDAVVVPGEKQIGLPVFSARVGGIALTARGAIALPPPAKPGVPTSLAETVSTRFPPLARQAMTIMAQLEALDSPSLDLDLAPSDTRLALVTASLTARGLNLETPLVAHIGGLHIVTRLPLLGDAPTVTRLELTADELLLPLNASARGVRALLLGRFRPGGYRFEPSELRVSAETVVAAGFTADALSAQLTPQPLPRLEADVVTRLMGAPLAVRASTDFATRSAVLEFSGAISPRILEPLSARLGANVRTWFDFQALDCEEGVVRLGPDWHFEKLDARVAVRGIDAYHVPIDEGHATIELGGGRVFAPEAWARIGANFARGSYEQDLKTLDYRFLLNGRLRPLDISGWFHDWWPNFFRQLEFPTAPPPASVDVSGRWLDSRQSHVFVFADAPQPVVRGVTFDRIRTRLFIRPGFYDGLELLATQGPGRVAGTFTYALDPATFDWRSFDLALISNLDLAVAAKLVGPAATEVLAPFTLAQTPALKLAGRFTSADDPAGAHQQLTIAARSPGEFRVHQFPLHDVAFNATLHDDDLAVDDLTARFGGGTVQGRAKIRGTGAQRRVSFDAALKDANLGAVAGALQDYAARTQGRPPTPPGKFVQEKANVRIDLAAAAEGRYGDPLSYQGEGVATIQGAEIGEVPLLGLLSDVLKFTALRFTTANAKFKLAGARVEFPEVTLRGANSAIDAHGDYLLDRKELDFKAKIFPFHESGNILKTVVGAVLTPISNVFEVKLTGSLEKPEWSLVLGPTNFLRSLAPGSSDPAGGKPGDSPLAPIAPVPATPAIAPEPTAARPPG